jgi:hypothetical protein
VRDNAVEIDRVNAEIAPLEVSTSPANSSSPVATGEAIQPSGGIGHAPTVLHRNAPQGPQMVSLRCLARLKRQTV